MSSAISINAPEKELYVLLCTPMDSSIAYFEVDVDYSIRSRDHSESVKRQTKAAIDKQRDEGTLVLKPGT